MTAPELRWLEGRRPAPPPALAERLRDALADVAGAADESVAERCLAAGERLLAGLLARGCGSRDAALDLLAADALVTYAFEAASAEPARLEERARRAMANLATIGERATDARDTDERDTDARDTDERAADERTVR